MSLTTAQKDKLKDILVHRDMIVEHIYNIERILKQYFPEEFDIAYQHYIPQIITALYEDSRWLPRGQYTLEQSVARIVDRMTGETIKKG
jgi:hypothetical protein